MIQKLFFLLIANAFILIANAQKTPAYAITSPEKGSGKWCEVKLINLATGQSLDRVHSITDKETEVLSSRSGKKIFAKDADKEKALAEGNSFLIVRKLHADTTSPPMPGNVLNEMNEPFAARSAACGYDVQNDRLYFTPLGIPQLRYIDLKDPSKIYYVDDVAFGVIKSKGDIASQITRMVFIKRDAGYALTNDGNHLITFKGKDKITITDLGKIYDDESNADYSVHNPRCVGGDLVADVFNNLYLVTSNHWVFRISIKTKYATYLGQIEGLPENFLTNGAIVEEGDNVIVASAYSTQGYYRFSLKDFKAIRLKTEPNVYNASDLANGNLLYDVEEAKTPEMQAEGIKAGQYKVSVYPNPVTTNLLKVRFDNLPGGDYHVKLTNMLGEIICSKDYTLPKGLQEVLFSLPKATAKGSYLLNVYNKENILLNSTGVIVQ